MKINPETIANIKLTVDPESVLNHLGFNIVKRGSKELRGPCKIHGGDNITGFRFNLESRTWCCYTRHCEGEGDRDLVGLVQKATGSSFVESVRFLADIAGVDLNNQEELSEQYLEMKQKLAEGEANKIFLPIQPSGIISSLAAMDEGIKTDPPKPKATEQWASLANFY